MRFLESKLAILELAHQSTQCMAKAYSVQAEIFQQRSMKKEESLCRMELWSSEKKEEVERLERNVKELEEMLRICKRRITEQNGNNARLHEQVRNYEQVCKLNTWIIPIS